MQTLQNLMYPMFDCYTKRLLKKLQTSNFKYLLMIKIYRFIESAILSILCTRFVCEIYEIRIFNK